MNASSPQLHKPTEAVAHADPESSSPARADDGKPGSATGGLGRGGRWLRELPSQAFKPVDIAFLVYFRIAFGSIMLWEVFRYFDHGWIPRYYIDPTWNIPYVGWSWVRPWPELGMYLHFYGLAILSLCVALGLWYRVTSVLFFLGFTYVFLLEKANYLNHFYLICLLAFLMIFLPAHHRFSLDARDNPRLRTDLVPAWTRWLLVGQIGIVYFFGGIAKINQDWLGGEPMRMWLAGRTNFPIIGQWFTHEWMVYLFSYGGLFLDLLIVPALLWSRTRPFAVIIAVSFHLTNAELFSIGIFPWFMIAATPLFFSADATRRWGRALMELVSERSPRRSRRPVLAGATTARGRKVNRADAMLASSDVTRPQAGGVAAKAGRTGSWSIGNPLGGWRGLTVRQRVTFALVIAFLGFQALFPLRHFTYAGNVSWTEEGHNWAWHMKLRSKWGDTTYMVTQPSTGETWRVSPREFLSPRQASKVGGQPDMIVQVAHYLGDWYRASGEDEVEIRVWAMASLNGREPSLLIDPTVDLLHVRLTPLPANWILPLDESVSVPAEFLAYAPPEFQENRRSSDDGWTDREIE